MSDTGLPIIDGAGPVGLGAALFLALNGRRTRVVERRTEPSQQSRALAVNPRTLEIMDHTGLVPQFLERGLPVHAAQLYRGERLAATIQFTNIHPKFPFMLALSQASTENILERALRAAGGRVEWGVRMAACRNTEGVVKVALEPAAGGQPELATAPWLLAADGAHSTARQQLGIDFPGSSLPDEWYLADVPLRTKLAEDRAHAFFLKGGGLVFLIRVVHDRREDGPGDRLWRVFATQPDPLSRLIRAEASGPPVWTSAFHIAHRINTALAAGHVYFAGDAAHIHSPLGARGMNLGLEDAWVFAQLERAGRLDEYDGLRRPVDARVVRRVELFTRTALGQSWFTRLARSVMLSVIGLPFVRQQMIRTLTGLDHPLTQIIPGRPRTAEPKPVGINTPTGVSHPQPGIG